MWTNHIILGLAALLAGSGVAVGAFAFLLVIGIIPRMLQKANLAKRVIFIENIMILGIIGGTISSVFIWNAPWGEYGFLHLFLGAFGIAAGAFVGSIAAALAEIINTFPVLFRRSHLKQGLPWIMAAMAFGKMAGSLFYFLSGYDIIGK